jgi:hypothetical protein
MAVAELQWQWQRVAVAVAVCGSVWQCGSGSVYINMSVCVLCVSACGSGSMAVACGSDIKQWQPVAAGGS